MLTPIIRMLLFVAVLLLCTVTSPGKVTAAENADQVGKFEALQQASKGLKKQRQTIDELEQMSASSDEQVKGAFSLRLDKAWLELLVQGVDFSAAVAAEDKSDPAVAPYRKEAAQTLMQQFGVADTAMKRISARFILPEPGLPVAKQSTAYSRVFTVQTKMNQVLALLVQSLEMAQDYKLDVVKQEAIVTQHLAEYAMKRSALLDMAQAEVTMLREGLATVTEDADLKSQLAVTSKYVKTLAEGLTPILALMEELGMDSSPYREQVLAATGEITSDVFEVGIIASLLVGWGQTLWEAVILEGPDLVFKILLFAVIVFAARKLAQIVQKVVESGLDKSQFALSELLRRMVVSIVRNIIVVLGFLIALSQVGISLGPLLAGLGVVGFVVGFALQDSLSNFASGLLILVYRPYDVGDLIDTAGVFGKVSHMSLVNTTIMTLDNQTIVIPNNKIWGDVIKNVTAQTNRRIDLMFGISYGDDIPKAERVLQGILDSHDKVLRTPEPIVRLHELGDSSVNFVVRPWVNRDDYWEVYWDVTRSVKMRFDEEAISIPFPQRDVHLISSESASTA